MSKINIANYLIGELSDGYGISANARHSQIIDSLIENWEKKSYLTPQVSMEKKVNFDNLHHIG